MASTGSPLTSATSVASVRIGRPVRDERTSIRKLPVQATIHGGIAAVAGCRPTGTTRLPAPRREAPCRAATITAVTATRLDITTADAIRRRLRARWRASLISAAASRPGSRLAGLGSLVAACPPVVMTLMSGYPPLAGAHQPLVLLNLALLAMSSAAVT